MTPEEKFWQLFMIPGSPFDENTDYTNGVFGLQPPQVSSAKEDAEQINAIQKYFIEQSRLGIPIIPFEEALHGLRRPDATQFPQAIGLAATWDVNLMSKISQAAAKEAKSRGIRMVLSPVVNIASDVRWGRTEETYGEDPFLSSQMATAFVNPFEEANIITTPKHFVANVADGGRDSWPVSLDERTLQDVHYPPFKAAFESGARSIMTSYNSVNGVAASQSKALLTNTLREELGFSGFVISDMSAVGGSVVLHNTEPNYPTAGVSSFNAGLDVILQSSWPEYRHYIKAVTDGKVSDEVIDAALERVLNAKNELGLFDQPYVNPDSAEYWNGHEDHIRLAREAAEASIVLLKNERDLLPLSTNFENIAVIGADAKEARFGGYSSSGVQPVSMLDGITAKFGSGVTFAEGPGRISAEVVPVPEEFLNVKAAYFANPNLEGEPVSIQEVTMIDNRWTFNRPAEGLETDWFSIRWEGSITVGKEEITQLGIEGDDGWRLYLDGTLLIDNWEKRSYQTLLKEVSLQPGTQHDVKLEFFETTGDARIRLMWKSGSEIEAENKLAGAVEVAQKSDLAIVVAGIEEGEFRDRAYLRLPGFQEELIAQVAETGVPVVVVLVGGSAITMPWLNEAESVLMAWYPGEQGGNALANILAGDVSPSGRLPITFPIFEGQLPLVYNHLPTGRGNDYLDLTGKPLFPFGYGLSYTSFEYSDLKFSNKTISADEEVLISCTIKNTGKKAGSEVVQLYIHDELTTVARPILELKGFERISLEPGEEKKVSFTLNKEALSLLNKEMERVVEPGEFKVYIGASSKDIRLKGIFEVK